MYGQANNLASNGLDKFKACNNIAKLFTSVGFTRYLVTLDRFTRDNLLASGQQIRQL